MKEIKDELLQQVNGGATDWKLFSQKVLEAIKQPIGELTPEHKKLIEAAKNKNYLEVSIIALPLIAKGDEFIKKILIETQLG